MLLKLGSVGEDVKKVQKLLKLEPDGKFGTETERAVKQWQREHGLLDDGIVGNQTWKVMFPAAIIVPRLPLNLHLLRNVIPASIIDSLVVEISKTDSNIDSILRVSHFLAQCAHESGMFSKVEENLNYSESGLLKVFPKYFTEEDATQFAYNPEAIANKVYSRRMGNGSEESGDGWKYRGRGYIQLTGKSSYKSFKKYINDDVVEEPELVSTKYAMASAVFYFDSNHVWKVCDKGADEKTVIRVSKAVNGGTIGIDSRISYFNKFYNILNES